MDFSAAGQRVLHDLARLGLHLMNPFGDPPFTPAGCDDVRVSRYNPGVLPRILVADDDRISAMVIAAALGDEFEVVVASSGAEALDRAQAGDIDLILLDVMMPDLNGFEVCQRLTNNGQSAVPVVFVTSLEETADEAHGFAIGAVDYISKPIRPAILRARVRTHIELKRSRDALERLAAVDPLTGIANRRAFDRALQLEWGRSQRSGRWLSVALVDVDHFKQFNDRYGHLAGDERLRIITGALADSTRRSGELAARYGGEEFALILPDVDPEMMRGIMRQVLHRVALAQPAMGTAGAHEVVTISAGAISAVATRGVGETAALAAADALLYDAKAAGRDCCVHHDWASEDKITIRRTLGSSMT